MHIIADVGGEMQGKNNVSQVGLNGAIPNNNDGYRVAQPILRRLISERGIKIHRLSDIVSALAKEKSFVIGGAGGADIVDLIHMSIDE